MAGEDTTEAKSDAAVEGDSIARNTSFAFAAQMFTAAATAAMTIYLVRALGPTGYGTFALALGVSALLLLPSDFGISASSARFIAEHRGRWDQIGALVRSSIRIKLVAGGVVSIVLIALADPIASAYHEPGLAWPLRAMAIALLGQSFVTFFTATFIALGRVSINLRLIASESLMEAGASVGLVLLGAGVTGAAFGRAIGYVFGATVGLVLVARTVGTRRLRTKTPPPVGSRRLAGYAGALFIIDGAYSLLGSSGTLLIGAFLDARQVGLFQPAIRLITFLHYPGLSVSTAIAPRLARRAGSEPDVPALERALRWLVLIQTVIVAPLIVWAHPLTKIVLGSGYGRTADVLMVLAPYTFLTGFAPLVSLSVNYLGEARRRVPVAIITLLLSVALNAALIPLIGIIGTAVSTDISYGFYVIAHFWICRRLLGLRLRPLVRDLARCVVAAGAMAGVMAAFGTSTLAAWQIVAGGTLGIAVYVGALFALGAMSVSEARVAIEAVRSKLGRRRPAVKAS